MDTEYFILYDGRQGQEVEYLGAVFPDIETPVFPETLFVEAVGLGDLSALVVAPYEEYALGVFHFQGHQQQEGFH